MKTVMLNALQNFVIRCLDKMGDVKSFSSLVLSPFSEYNCNCCMSGLQALIDFDHVFQDDEIRLTAVVPWILPFGQQLG